MSMSQGIGIGAPPPPAAYSWGLAPANQQSSTTTTTPPTPSLNGARGAAQPSLTFESPQPLSSAVVLPPLNSAVLSQSAPSPYAPPFERIGAPPEDADTGLLNSAAAIQQMHPHHKHKPVVLLVTFAVYGSFWLMATGGILSLPALNSSRGRFPRYVFGRPENIAYRRKSLTTLFDAQKTAFERRPRTKPQGFLDRLQSANPQLAGRDPIDRYISVEKNPLVVPGAETHLIHDRAWLTKIGTEGEAFLGLLGFFSKGAIGLDGARVAEEEGRLFAAAPCHDAEAESPEFAERLRAASFKPLPHTADRIVTDPQSGALAARVWTRSAPKTTEEMERLVQSVAGIDPATLKDDLQKKGRLHKSDSLLTAHEWNVQYELQKGTPWATAGGSKQKLGQVLQRHREYWKGGKSALCDPNDSGMRMMHMTLSSTWLNANLAIIASGATIYFVWFRRKNQDDQS